MATHILQVPERPYRQTWTKPNSKSPLKCRADRFGLPCGKDISSDGWPWLCKQHTDEYKESYKRYKAASESAEAIRQCVLVWEDNSQVSEIRTLAEVRDAIELTETYIDHAEKELRGRELHTMAFFAQARPDPGHLKRTHHVEQQISSAYRILDHLRDRLVDLTPPEPRQRKKRNRRRRQNGGILTQDEEELPALSCCAISFDLGYVEEDEESPLASGLDEEEALADLRTEREAEEMLRWYAEQDGTEDEEGASDGDVEEAPMGPFVSSLVETLVRLGLTD